MCGVASPLENVHPVSLPWVLPRRAPLGPAHHAHVDVKRPRRAAFFSRNGRTFGSPRRAPSARVRLGRRARVQGGSLDDFSRPSLPGSPRVAGPKPRHSSSRGFVFRRFARVKKSQLKAMRQCAISDEDPKIGKMNTHSQNMTVNHWKKRYAFDKIVQPSSGIFLGFQTIDP